MLTFGLMVNAAKIAELSSELSNILSQAIYYFVVFLDSRGHQYVTALNALEASENE